MITDILLKLFRLAARSGNMGYKLDDRKSLGWTRPHQGAQEIERRRRQAQARARVLEEKRLLRITRPELWGAEEQKRLLKIARKLESP